MVDQEEEGCVFGLVAHGIDTGWPSAVGLTPALLSYPLSYLAGSRTATQRTGGPDTLGYGVAVGFYQFVHHIGYFVEREHARSMPV